MGSILSRLKDLAEIPDDLWCIPEGIWKDIVRSKEDREKKLDAIAYHEAGHALVALLGAHPMEKLRISRRMSSTRNLILKILVKSGLRDPILDRLASGEIKISQSLESGDDKELFLIFLLAGLAATKDLPIFKETWGNCTEEWNVDEWTDITIPRDIVTKAIKEQGFQGTNEEVKKVLSSLFASIIKVFKNENIQQALLSIKKTAITHRTLVGTRGQDTIMEGLTNDGIDQSCFPEMLSSLRNGAHIDSHIVSCLGRSQR